MKLTSSWVIDPNDLLFLVGFSLFIGGLLTVAPQYVVPGIGGVVLLAGILRAK